MFDDGDIDVRRLFRRLFGLVEDIVDHAFGTHLEDDDCHVGQAEQDEADAEDDEDEGEHVFLVAEEDDEDDAQEDRKQGEEHHENRERDTVDLADDKDDLIDDDDRADRDQKDAEEVTQIFEESLEFGLVERGHDGDDAHGEFARGDGRDGEIRTNRGRIAEDDDTEDLGNDLKPGNRKQEDADD